ncbi:MAG: hypothetical protein WCV84_04540 [Patescibacteria group bacterium]
MSQYTADMREKVIRAIRAALASNPHFLETGVAAKIMAKYLITPDEITKEPPGALALFPP